MADIRKRVLFTGLVALVVLTLGACREPEQGRQLSLEPGKFLGNNPDTSLSDTQRATLRSRLAYQAGSQL